MWRDKPISDELDLGFSPPMSVSTAANETTYRKAVNHVRSEIKRWASLFVKLLVCLSHSTFAVPHTEVYIFTPSMSLWINCRLPMPYSTNKKNESRWSELASHKRTISDFILGSHIVTQIILLLDTCLVHPTKSPLPSGATSWWTPLVNWSHHQEQSCLRDAFPSEQQVCR